MTSSTSRVIASLASKPTVAASTVLHWFRTDLRIEDNSALQLASRAAVRLSSGGANTNLACLYIVSPIEWHRHACAPVKVDFWLRNVEKLRESLAERGIPLVVKLNDDRRGWKAVPELVEKVCKELNVNELYYNIEYEVNEQQRDKLVKELLVKSGVS
ncbi:hypothetical protein HDU93_002354, partial [Gonapodya sp. JEL0774]